MRITFTMIVRTLLRNRIYALLNILGLAIGLACFGLIVAWVLNELSYDRFHANHDRIVRVVDRVTTDSEAFDQAVTSPPMAGALVRDYPEVEAAVRLSDRGSIVQYEDKQFDESHLLFVDDSFFEVFSYRLTRGDEKTALKNPYSIVLTESIAEKYFGSENPIGRALTIYQFDPGGNGAPYTVTGVMPDPPRNSHVVFNFLGSFSTIEKARPEVVTGEWRWFHNGFYTYLLLRDGADRSALEAKLPEFAERYLGDKMRELRTFLSFSLQPLDDIYLHSDLRYEIQATGSVDTVGIFATIGIMVLLVACINYMNLATARAIGRAREIGVKKILGADRMNLVRHFLIESLLVAMVSFGIALLLMELAQPFVAEVAGKPLQVMFSLRLLGLLLSTTILVGLLSGLYPALFISSFKPLSVIKGWKSATAGILIRKGLVIVQFTVSILLLIGIGVVWNQMSFIRSKNLGYDKENLLILNQNGFSEVNEGIGPFRDELLSHRGILGVATSRGLLVGGLSNSYIETIDGEGKSVSTSIYRHQVSPEYFDVYHMKILAGRPFAAADTGSAYIVNEAAVKMFGWGSPADAIGKPFGTGGPRQGRVIGVVGNFHYSSLENPIEPVALSLTDPGQFSRISVRLAGGAPDGAISFVENTWRKHFPGAMLQYSFMNDRLERQYRNQAAFGRIFFMFVVLSLVVACLGLFGLASFATDQRIKEVGIRKVLGASIPGVVFLLSRDFLKLVVAAFFLAAPVAYLAMSRWLEDFAYRTDISPGVFLFAGVIALVIAFSTVAAQAIRAALSNPVDALRYE